MNSIWGLVTNNNLIIVGASVRAAAQSAHRAGLIPVGCDLFADRDLREISETYRIKDYPREVLSLLDDLPNDRWMFTGAWENYPELVAQISKRRALLGNPEQVLRLVCDPFRVSDILNKAQLPTAEIRKRCDPPSDHRQWLLKPVHSGAGVGIAKWKRNSGQKKRLGESLALPNREKLSIIENDRGDDTFYFQETIVGESYSAIFFATERRCWMWGVTRQLVGITQLGAKPFSYCGSLGPIDLPGKLQFQVEKIGDVLRASFGLRGIFGVDFIVRDGEAITIEVNPRYPASAEVLEYATGKSAISLHASCFDKGDENHFPMGIGEATALSGKTILFAPHRVQVPDLCPLRKTEGTRGNPSLADIPEAGSQIGTGHPICTVLTCEENPELSLRKLSERVVTLQKVLGIETTDSIFEAMKKTQKYGFS